MHLINQAENLGEMLRQKVQNMPQCDLTMQTATALHDKITFRIQFSVTFRGRTWDLSETLKDKLSLHTPTLVYRAICLRYGPVETYVFTMLFWKNIIQVFNVQRV